MSEDRCKRIGPRVTNLRRLGYLTVVDAAISEANEEALEQIDARRILIYEVATTP
jgi:hypothetical protein